LWGCLQKEYVVEHLSSSTPVNSTGRIITGLRYQLHRNMENHREKKESLKHKWWWGDKLV
jgi:hypothetical protein